MPVWMNNRENVMEESYKGSVLTTREKNYHDDSDFYAIVWDDEDKALKRIFYDTTRFAGGGNAKVDATEEVKEKANAYLYEWSKKAIKRESERESAIVREGKEVEVVRGRKYPKGLRGLVVREFKKVWKWTETSMVEVALDAEVDLDGEYINTIEIARANVEVVKPELYEMSEEEIAKKAEKSRNYWHLPYIDGSMYYV